jgi:hypothetical protein
VPHSVSRRSKNHVTHMADNLLTPCLFTQAMEDMAAMKVITMAVMEVITMEITVAMATEATVRFSSMPPQA